MAGESLQWKLTLKDDVSGPAKKAARGAFAFQQAARKLQADTARVQAAAVRGQARTAQQVARLNANAFRADQRLAAQRARLSSTNAASARRGESAVAQSFRGTIGTLGTVLSGFAAAGAGIIGSFAGIGLAAAGAVIRMAAFRESSLASLEAVTGSSMTAQRMFRNAMVMANQTPADTQDVVRDMARFATAGFNERESGVMTAATADLSAAFGRQQAESFAYVASQLRSSGRSDRGDLRQLNSAGVNTGSILDSLGRQLNIQGADQTATRAAVLARVRGGGVSGDQMLQGALSAISQRLDGGAALGSFARRQSETLTGALSNMANASTNLLLGIDFSKIPGMVALRQGILSITSAFDASTPSGLRLQKTIGNITNRVSGFVAGFQQSKAVAVVFSTVGRAFGAIGRFASAAWPVVQAFVTGLGPGFMAGIAPLRALFASLLTGGAPSAVTMALIARAALGLGQAFGFVVGTAISFVGVVGSVVAAITTLAASAVGLATSVVMPFRTAFLSVGAAIINGIRDGIAGGAASLLGGIASLTRGTVDAAKNALGIHSPSTVFRDEVGRQIPAGMVDGVSGGAAPVNDAVAGLANPAAMNLGGMGGVSIVAHISITEAGSARETAREVLAEFEDQLGAVLAHHAEAFG